MLASLLPGVRELRTPLAVGYLWLLVLWLALAPRVSRENLPSEVRSLPEVSGLLDPLIVGTAVTFAALLLGIVAEGLYDMTVRLLVRQALPSDPVRGFLGWRALLARFESGVNRLRSGPTKGGLRSVKLAAREKVREAETVLRRGGADIRDLVVALGFVRGRRDRVLSDPELARVRERLSEVSAHDIRESLTAWLVIRILDQLDLLARRLAADHPQLFTDYDRLRSEAQFRSAVAPPLLVLVILVSLTWTWWVALAAAALPVLVRQAIRKGDQASDLLIDAMLIGKIEAPAFEQLTRVTAELDAATVTRL